MATPQEFRFEIIDDTKRASKWDLARGLFDGLEFEVTVKFSTIDASASTEPPECIGPEVKHTAKVGLLNIEAEDGSHESWIMRGYVSIGAVMVRGSFWGYIRTDHRPDSKHLGYLYLTQKSF